MDNMIDSHSGSIAKRANKAWANEYLPANAKEEQWSITSPLVSAWSYLTDAGQNQQKYSGKSLTPSEMRNLLLERELQRRSKGQGPSSAWKMLLEQGEFAGPFTIDDQLK